MREGRLRERERDGMSPFEALGQAVPEASSPEPAEVGSGANNLPISSKLLGGSFLSSYIPPPDSHMRALSQECLLPAFHVASLEPLS